MLRLERSLPTLFVGIGAGFALKQGDWPGAVVFVSSLVLYGAMRFLERSRADEMAALNDKVAALSDKLGSLAMTVGARGIL